MLFEATREDMLDIQAAIHRETIDVAERAKKETGKIQEDLNARLGRLRRLYHRVAVYLLDTGDATIGRYKLDKIPGFNGHGDILLDGHETGLEWQIQGAVIAAYSKANKRMVASDATQSGLIIKVGKLMLDSQI